MPKHMQATLLEVDTVLLTPRTVVRRFREGDGALLYELLRENHTRLIEHFPQLMRDVSEKDQAEFYVRRRLASWLLQDEFSFAVWENESARLIGMIRLFNLEWRISRAETDYFIDQQFSGRGLMTEALLAVIRFAFEQLCISKLCLRASMDNYASQRLARKCGFRREGDLREEYRRISGELVDVMLFGLARSEYEKL